VVNLDHSYVGCAKFKIGDVYTVHGSYGTIGNTVVVRDVYGKKWDFHHEDIELVVEYTHPMQEHLGKEVYVPSLGMRGFVVSYCNQQGDDSLLVDFGVGYSGHIGSTFAINPQKTNTHAWVKLYNLEFLTEDDL